MLDPNSLPLDALCTLLRATGLPRRLMEIARDEDLGPYNGYNANVGDLTSQLGQSPAAPCSARIVAREAGVVSGLAWIADAIEVFGLPARAHLRVTDGEEAQAGATLATIDGPKAGVLTLERTILNLVGRLSGIATRTRAFVRAARQHNPSVRVLDTRKTTPGVRALEKYAVRCGGGFNHRYGLFDAILLKDNHLASLSPSELIKELREVRAGLDAKGLEIGFVEIEVDSLEQLAALLSEDDPIASIVLLDNMSIEQLDRAVALNRARQSRGLRPVLLEASGGVRPETIGPIAATGVDRVSVGSLTHGATSLDVALDME